MADGPFRHYGAGSGQQYFFQQHPKHLSRAGSPGAVTRSLYSTDTPSPSRSPTQNNTHHFNMFGQGQNNMMNGANGHTRYMLNNQHKFGHQSHQHHNQQNHHHHPNHGGHPGHGNLGHQHTFSGGMNLNSNQNYNAGVQNDALNDDHIDINDSLPEHWQYQLQLYADVRQNLSSNHRHSRKQGAQPTIKSTTQPQADDPSKDGDAGERNRGLMILNSEPAHDWDGLDMSGQGLRVLSQTLVQSYSFLTKLFVDNNKISQLPEEIGTLRHLTVLQASNNMLCALPQSIGMLSNLQELLVFANRIESLPNELGYLYKLETLGIEGNPIHSDTREFIMQNGTRAYVAHLRDNTEPTQPPRERQMIILDDSESADKFTVLDWNILCDKYVNPTHYPSVPTKALEWEYRRDLIIEEIKSRDPDVLCLQEIDAESYEEFFRRELAYYHYKGIFWQKSRARTMTQREAKLVDGCAIFYKSQKYIMLDKLCIDFANTAINRPDMKGEHDIFNRVMPRDHVALAAFLENRMTGSRMIVANAHIFWDPNYEDVKIVQVAILMENLSNQADKWAKMPPKTDKAIFRHTEQDVEGDAEKPEVPQGEPAPSMEYSTGAQIPLIACGDFNVSKGDGIYNLISRGSLPPDHPDLSGRSYGNFTREGMSHHFKLKSAYSGENRDYIEFTNYTTTFHGLIDYIWHSTSLQLRSVLGDIDFDYISRVPGFPSYHFPSDHLPLMAEFGVVPRKERKVVEANFGPQRERRT